MRVNWIAIVFGMIGAVIVGVSFGKPVLGIGAWLLVCAARGSWVEVKES